MWKKRERKRKRRRRRMKRITDAGGATSALTEMGVTKFAGEESRGDAEEYLE